MGHGYKLDRFRGINKKKLAIAALFVGIVLVIILIIIGAIAVAIVSALLGQADTNIGQSIGNIITSLWNYAIDFINALWRQVIANPLQFLTGGNS
ncbi:MAG: hypothetical protein EOT05_01045 [Candidatus Microsaccharimonas sossegonensis]|uniref:Uncharacterized protein n=1 Tax=Candidatus Microsaccharimonas sossegonensis TaxID=2506948 RepID=A0A4V1J7D8_9BACT|nr:MAG: hypothetical protein EOT05_01045 [Candidatus Microsaccharimonas sossegonensis]